MHQLNAEELNTRINSFLTKKHEQYPELALREDKGQAVTEHTPRNTFNELLAGIKWEYGR